MDRLWPSISFNIPIQCESTKNVFMEWMNEWMNRTFHTDRCKMVSILTLTFWMNHLYTFVFVCLHAHTTKNQKPKKPTLINYTKFVSTLEISLFFYLNFYCVVRVWFGVDRVPKPHPVPLNRVTIKGTDTHALCRECEKLISGWDFLLLFY